MPLKVTTKGRIQLSRAGVLISQHNVETEAIESATTHAEQHGDGDYVLKFPEKVLRVLGTLAQSTTDTSPPTVPQNLVATAQSAGSVQLTWSASSDNVGVTGYQVWRNGSPLITTTQTNYTDGTAQPSTAYSYTVSAFDAAGNSSAQSSQSQVTTPANASPTWQTIPAQTLIVGNSFSLNLALFAADADQDTLTYSIVSGTLPTGLTLSGALISGTPTTAGQTPTVTVRAADQFSSANRDIAFSTFSEDVTAPPVPTGLAATANSSSTINLTWNSSTDAAGSANEFVSGTQDYRVYRSTDQTNFSLRTTVSTPSYSDTGLGASTRYDYKVTARDVRLNESAQSSAVNATTQGVAAGFSAQSPFSASGSVTHGSLMTISRSSGSFGTRSDTNISNFTWNTQNHLMTLVKDWEDNQMTGRGTFFDPDWNTPNTKWAMHTLNPPTNLTRCIRRFNQSGVTGAEQGGIQYLLPVAHTQLYVTFKYRITRPRRSGKFFRIYGQGGRNVYFSTGDPGDASWNDTDKYGIRAGQENLTFSTQYDGLTPILGNGTWHRIEIFVNDGVNLTVWKDGQQRWSVSLSGTILSTANTIDLGHMIDNEGRSPIDPTGMCEEFFADWIMDSTRNRFEIADTATWAARTRSEIQIPTSWSTTSVTFAVNRGEHSTLVGKYLYHLDTNNAATLIGQYT